MVPSDNSLKSDTSKKITANSVGQEGEFTFVMYVQQQYRHAKVHIKQLLCIILYTQDFPEQENSHDWSFCSQGKLISYKNFYCGP